MKILLDTHIIVWYFEDNKQLSQKACDIIEDEANEIYYSLVSLLEVEIKHAAHPHRLSLRGEDFLSYCKELGFIQAPLNIWHVLELKNLTRKKNTPPHRDPFDRLMLCQAIVEDMIFITHDERIAEYVTDCIYKV